MRSELLRRQVVVVWVLLAQAMVLSQGLSPWLSGHCECTHGPEIPCHCPHHRARREEETAAEDESLPPCHRAMKAAAPAREEDGAQSGLRNRCAGPSLVLVALTTGETRPTVEDALARPESAPVWAPILTHALDRTSAPPRPPPRS